MQPIDSPVVGIGPGSQPGEEDGTDLEYLRMPSGMATYRPPPLPEPDEIGDLAAGLECLEHLHRALSGHRIGEPSAVIDLSDLDPPNADLVNQTLGEGEVSILYTGPEIARIQETRLAGVWRVRIQDDPESPWRDVIEVADIPDLVRTAAFRGARGQADPGGEPGAGVLNAPPILIEINDKVSGYRSGDDAHVINLTLLPQTQEDLAYLDERLGSGPMSILSRGYGNCRVMAAGVDHVWWVQHFNSEEKLILRVAASTLEKKLDAQRTRLKLNFRLEKIVRAPESSINRICEQVARVAPYDIPVLIGGESGTGKELFARAVHYNSLRADKPFVAENCGAMPDQLLESELFGHKRGAFTGAVSDRIGLFEQADGGTIFLDEIGDVSPTFQVKLLRVLQEGEVRPIGSNQRRKVKVRVVAATNKDLEQEIRAGRFREDLFYRLAGVRIHLPPLRERRVDIPVIARCLLDEAIDAFGKPTEGFTQEAIACMQEYHWPGNVRELRNEIQRVLVMSEGARLGAELLSPRVLRAAPRHEEPEMDLLAGLDGTLKDRVMVLEERVLRETLIRHRWNKSRAADELGLSRVGLRNKLERYGLKPHIDA